MKSPRFDAALFDCDGVLVDSEAITNGVLHEMLVERGWTALTAQDCMRIFIGRAVKDQRELIERNTGQPLTEQWLADFRERRNLRLARTLLAIEGAVDAVAEVHALTGGRIACASGADRGKVELQLRKCGLLPFFEGRVFSGHELPRSKPAPDVYLAAAAALGVDPGRCVVIEDTVVGVTAGVAAGCTVFGYSPPEAGHDAPQPLLDAGAERVFTRMSQLPALVRGD